MQISTRKYRKQAIASDEDLPISAACVAVFAPAIAITLAENLTYFTRSEIWDSAIVLSWGSLIALGICSIAAGLVAGSMARRHWVTIAAGLALAVTTAYNFRGSFRWDGTFDEIDFSPVTWLVVFLLTFSAGVALTFRTRLTERRRHAVQVGVILAGLLALVWCVIVANRADIVSDSPYHREYVMGIFAVAVAAGYLYDRRFE